MDSKYFNKIFGENKTTELLPRRYNEISNSHLFIPIHQVKDSFIVFKIS